MPITDVERLIARPLDSAFAPEFAEELARAGSRQEAGEILVQIGARRGHVFSAEEALAVCDQARAMVGASLAVPSGSGEDAVLEGVRGGSSIFSGNPPPNSPQMSLNTMDSLFQMLSGNVGGSPPPGNPGEPSGSGDYHGLLSMLSQFGLDSGGGMVGQFQSEMQDRMDRMISNMQDPSSGG